MKVQDYLNQVFMYGGEPRKLGDIIADLESLGLTPKQRDMYLMGLTLKQKRKETTL